MEMKYFCLSFEKGIIGIRGGIAFATMYTIDLPFFRLHIWALP